jgi:hypothetical protein
MRLGLLLSDCVYSFLFFLSRSFILDSHLVCLGDRFLLLDRFKICFFALAIFSMNIIAFFFKVLLGGNVP